MPPSTDALLTAWGRAAHRRRPQASRPAHEQPHPQPEPGRARRRRRTTPVVSAAADPAQLRQLVSFLLVLFGRERRGALINVRYRDPERPEIMRHGWHDTHQPADAARDILALGRLTDTYIGVAPRQHRDGGKAAIAHAWALWVDCDTPQAAAAMKEFTPAPSIVIRSGSATNCHAYWPLTRPVAVAELERGNQALARELGGCTSAVMNAAAILRPPGTHNFKRRPASPVVLERLRRQLLDADELLARLPMLPPTPERPEPPAGREEDPLLRVAPRDYVRVLTGQTPNRAGKTICPFHEDDTPSLHAYPTGQGGWYCYGCRRGGSVYDLAALLWGVGARRGDFVRLRDRLHHLLMGGPWSNDPGAAAAPGAGCRRRPMKPRGHRGVAYREAAIPATLRGPSRRPPKTERTMSEHSRIEWTSASWNPVTGCDQVSPGCAHCYAKTFAERFRGVPGHPYEQGFDLRIWPERLELPLRWRRPRLIFVNSMSDLFHEGIPDDYIERCSTSCAARDQHVFQVLTKRHERLAGLAPSSTGRRTYGWASASRTAASYTGPTTCAPCPRRCASSPPSLCLGRSKGST